MLKNLIIIIITCAKSPLNRFIYKKNSRGNYIRAFLLFQYWRLFLKKVVQWDRIKVKWIFIYIYL